MADLQPCPKRMAVQTLLREWDVIAHDGDHYAHFLVQREALMHAVFLDHPALLN